MSSVNNQTRLDDIYRKMSADYGKLNDRQVTSAIKDVGRIRGDIAELLSEFADNEGTVKRQRLSRLLRELDTVEKSLREYGTVSMTKVIGESSEFALKNANKAADSLLGTPMVSGGIEKINKNVIDYVMRRTGDDGLVLSDRVWGTSGEIKDSIASVLRSGIIRGDSVSELMKAVKNVYDAENWKIKRLVVTEGNTAYRVASANSIRESEVADYVKINENGHRHGNHTNHRCYKLAQIDKYGEGKGIYLPTDTEIYTPHPQCSSYITAVLKEEYLTGMVGGKVTEGNNVLSDLYGGKDDMDIEEEIARSIGQRLKGEFKGAGTRTMDFRYAWTDDNKSEYAMRMENYFSEKYGLPYELNAGRKVTNKEKLVLDMMHADVVAKFKEAGITHVKVYRGIAYDSKNNWLPDDVDNMTLTGRGLTSWTMRKDVAKEYASYVDDTPSLGNMAGVLEAVIPVEKIAMTAIVGDTDEIVVIGDIVGAKLVNKRRSGRGW